MRVRIQKWGNSLALRIPKSFATETAIDTGTDVDLAVDGDKLVITPIKSPAYRLDDLLARISPSNLHGEQDTGEAVGAEVW